MAKRVLSRRELEKMILAVASGLMAGAVGGCGGGARLPGLSASREMPRPRVATIGRVACLRILTSVAASTPVSTKARPARKTNVPVEATARRSSHTTAAIRTSAEARGAAAAIPARTPAKPREGAPCR